ncbi:hypothetical protein C8J95_102147 [Elizabethkingia sp. YR214]|uniref:hypothetical protein n=1 Tax=Elizabethkingia sp. YR214 TaxID=2135667 RepID=UPI000D319EAF|nr:hypothetical protein [Elizabethkingia sp. YR214]PUB34483.1 hypothetical protein C8J95_102147 [Elizabethkingia sp. YR214]
MNISYNPSILKSLLKVWVISNILPALLIQIYNYSPENFWFNLLFVSACGLLISVPAMLILAILIKRWTNKKTMIIPVSVLLVFITFYMAGFRCTDFPLAILYSITISGSILIINLKSKSDY